MLGFALLGLLACGLVISSQAEGFSQPTLDPTTIPKYEEPLVIPPAMPKTSNIIEYRNRSLYFIEYYEIAVRQFQQQILPTGFRPKTTVWGYGSINHPETFNYPAFTIEAKVDIPLRIKWINDLKDPVTGEYLPHLLPVDPTLHWANPPGGEEGRDMRPMFEEVPGPYTGPVPIVTHMHGAHTTHESDGYAEAWYLPDASNIPAGYATVGSYYDVFKQEFEDAWGVTWEPGTSVFQYPNDQRAATMWFHDHTLGLTRLNVYAGPAGFCILRGGESDKILGYRAPKRFDDPEERSNIVYTEIPIAIQDRSFNDDGSLFYPDSREFFDGFAGPFIPDSDISPIWNPEFFGNTMVVNGKTWPYLEVEKRRYRFRFLDGCNSRFLILRAVKAADINEPGTWAQQNGFFWQIGTEGGFLPAPVQLDELIMGPAERADVIVDFSKFQVGDVIYLINAGPDEPFGGGTPGVDFAPANPATTGQVMKFTVVPRTKWDLTSPPDRLELPTLSSLGPESKTRKLSLNEESSTSVCVNENGEVVDCGEPGAEPFGPRAALLGTINEAGEPVTKMWDDPITENPALDATEVWEFYNFTMDAHPIHIHEIFFQVVNRQNLATDGEGETMIPVELDGPTAAPQAWETGYKDTVIAYPGQVTRVKAKFDLPGLYVWHCHIVEHEDNEMMRPYFVGTPAPDFPVFIE
jgi:bilirubin oxidase